MLYLINHKKSNKININETVKKAVNSGILNESELFIVLNNSICSLGGFIILSATENSDAVCFKINVPAFNKAHFLFLKRYSAMRCSISFNF